VGVFYQFNHARSTASFCLVRDFPSGSQFLSLLGLLEVSMDSSIELTLEQEFNLRNFADQAHRMSREQAQEFLIVQYRLMLVQKTMYLGLLKQEWNLELNPTNI
jgi:hypothetical protein